MRSRTPSTSCRVRQTNSLSKWDTCPESQNVICRKKFWESSSDLQLTWLQISAETFHSCCSIQRCGQSNPLDTLARAAKHQQHDQIARWIFDGASLCFCHLQNRPCNNYCTHPRVCEDPSHPRLDVVLKVWPLHCLLYIIWKYNSDRDMLDQSSTSLDTITLSRSPRGWEPRAS